jgi:hypothetical protein
VPLRAQEVLQRGEHLGLVVDEEDRPCGHAVSASAAGPGPELKVAAAASITRP